MENNLFPSPWVSPTQETQDEEDKQEDASSILDSPPCVNQRDRFYVRNPHSSFPPFVSQTQRDDNTSAGGYTNVTTITGECLSKRKSSDSSSTSDDTNQKKSSTKGSNKKRSSKKSATTSTKSATKSSKKRKSNFRVGSVVSSMGVGKFLPIEKGQRARRRERV